MCLKLLSKLLTKKDDMPKPNDFVYSSDYRQPYIYEVFEKSVTAPATSNVGGKQTILDIPHNYQHRPLTLGYASTDANFAEKHPLNEIVWQNKTSTVGQIMVDSYSTLVEAYDDKIRLRAVTDKPNMSAKTIYFRVFLINRLNDSIPGKRQIVPKGNFNLNTDYSNIQIYKEGIGTIPAGQTSMRITHDLGYAPIVLCWSENNYYPSDPTHYLTDEIHGLAKSTKDYIDFSFVYADAEDYDFYYMILTERIPDGQSS
jgi:hypothetical protein